MIPKTSEPYFLPDLFYGVHFRRIWRNEKQADIIRDIASLDDEIDRNMHEQYRDAVDAVDAVTGIGPDSAKAILSVIGIDMSRFPSDAHLASWAGLCPGNNESAGKRRSGKTTKGNKLPERQYSLR